LDRPAGRARLTGLRWLLVLALAGCATTMPPPLPGQGGPRWLELTSEHFVFWTDLPSDQARAKLRDLEEFRGAMLAFAFGGRDVPGRSLVVGLRRYDEWSYYGHRAAAVGMFVPAPLSPLGWPTVTFTDEMPEEWNGITDVNEGLSGATTMHHEIAHLVTASFVHNQPRWLAEGIAQFFESATIDPATRQVEVGQPPEHVKTWGRLSGRATVLDILRPTSIDDAGARFYVTSWLLTAYLLHERAKDFASYQRVLGQLPAAERERAWSATFPDLPPDRAEDALAAWVKDARLTVSRFRLVGPVAHIEERPMSDPQVGVARAMIRYSLLRGDDDAAAVRAAACDPAAALELPAGTCGGGQSGWR
jgi:hypothetical protein